MNVILQFKKGHTLRMLEKCVGGEIILHNERVFSERGEHS
jgi:hypothetical protein